jgi:hypothetical protein
LDDLRKGLLGLGILMEWTLNTLQVAGIGKLVTGEKGFSLAR